MLAVIALGRYTMFPNRRVDFSFFLVLGTFVFSPAASEAGFVTADANTGALAAPGSVAGATHDLLAFSQVLPNAAGVVPGTNVVTRDSFLGPGIPAVTRFGDEIVVGIIFRDFYSPPVGFRGRPKPGVAAGVRAVTSDTPAGPPAAPGAHGFASYTPPGIAGAAGVLHANGSVIGVPGGAAGEAIDPFDLAPGTYNYFFTINEILLRNDNADEVSGVTFFATDSRFSDRLWALGVSAEGFIGSKDDLIIEFFSNPILGLNDGLIARQVRDALTVSGGTASLSSFQVFHTTYAVDQTITFAEGLNAGVQTVPEPSTLTLLGMGVLSLFVYRRRRSKDCHVGIEDGHDGGNQRLP